MSISFCLFCASATCPKDWLNKLFRQSRMKRKIKIKIKVDHSQTIKKEKEIKQLEDTTERMKEHKRTQT